MSSIDRRVVELEFDNKQFESGIKDTLNSLDALQKGLKLEGATKGLTDLQTAGNNFSLDGMASGIDHIANRFSALGAIGFSILQRLTNAAMDFGSRIIGNIMDPLVAGGKRRALNLQQAEFMFEGLGMDIEATMESALKAVKGTAFGLDEAAKAASQFGASGMRAGDDMTSALTAISGVAAMTNSSYEDIANVFTKVAGNGRLMGDDLLRMSSRGLNAAATLAKEFNKTEEEIRTMVTEGEVSFEMFYTAMDKAFGKQATKANETYTGSLANMRAALSRIGAQFFSPWLLQQRDLFNALSPAIDSVGDALKPVIKTLTGFTGAKTKQLIDFINAIDFSKTGALLRPILSIIRDLGSLVGSVLRPIRDAFLQIFPPASLVQIRNILRAIKEFTSGLTVAESSGRRLRRTFAGVFAIFGIGWEIVKAGVKFFFELFGVVTEGSGSILNFTAKIGDFLVALHQAIKNGEGLTNFFKGLKGVLEGPIRFIKRIGSALLELFDFEAPSADRLTGIFEPLGRLGEMLIGIWDRVLASLERVRDAFKPITDFLVKVFGKAIDGIMEFFSDLNFDQILDTLNTGLLGGIFLMIQRFADNLSNSFGSIQYNLTEPFKRLTFTLNTMQNTLRAMTLMQIAIAVALLAGSVLALSKVDAEGLARALAALSGIFVQMVAFLAVFTRLGGITGLIGAAGGLVVLALAIRVLVSSMDDLAELDWEELAKGLSSLAVLLGLVVLSARGLSGHSAGMIAAGAGLLVLAFGIKVLASAVEDLAELDWEELAKGLVGVAALLVSLGIFTKLTAVNKGGIAQGAGLILLASGIKILADAVEQFADLSWENVGKGLTAITGILAAFAIFAKAMGNPSGIVATGVSLILVGAAMKILASAMDDFSNFSWEEIGKGLTTIAGALTAIGLALTLMPPSTLASATAILIVSAALKVIADVMEDMGGMDWDEIGRGLTVLAGGLVLIAGAMFAMQGAIPGAAALVIVSGALAVLAPVLIMLGSMSWGEIAKGLVTLAGAFTILGLAGLVLTPVVPTLIALGIAIGLLGAGLLAAGAGLLLFSMAITALAVAGSAGIATIVAIVEGLIGLLPMLFTTLGEAIIALLQVFIDSAPVVLEAMNSFIGVIITAIRENLPDILETFKEIIVAMLELMVELTPEMSEATLNIMLAILIAMNDKVPDIVAAMYSLIIAILEEMAKGVPGATTAAINIMIAFLTAIAGKIGEVVDAGTEVIKAYIRALGANAAEIADEGMKAVITFVNAVADSVETHSGEMREAGRRLAVAIADGMTGGLISAVGRVAAKAREMAASAVAAAREMLDSDSPSKVFRDIGLDIGDGLVIGLEKSGRVVGDAAGGVGEDAIDAMMKSIVDISDLFGDEIDLNPTITPVLDLDGFRRDASQIGSTLSEQMSVASAFSKAKDVSIKHRANEAARHEELPDKDISAPALINYVQNNHSPKALSAAEIYRQTKNQLSTARGALTP